MPEHSAGPWTLHRFEDTDDGGGEDWFRLSADSTLHVEIAACSDGYVPGQNEANAYLLWAALDLLAACEKFDELDMCEGYGLNEPDYPKLWEALGMARAAIAKARGQGPTT